MLVGSQDHENVVVAGLRSAQWLGLWRYSHSIVEGIPARVAFPNGEPLDEQPAILVEMFSIIEEEWRKESQEQIKRGFKQRN